MLKTKAVQSAKIIFLYLLMKFIVLLTYPICVILICSHTFGQMSCFNDKNELYYPSKNDYCKISLSPFKPGLEKTSASIIIFQDSLQMHSSFSMPKRHILSPDYQNDFTTNESDHYKSKVKLSLKLGYGFTFYDEWAMDTSFTSLYDKLKHGVCFNAEVSYFFSKVPGIGLLYSFYHVQTKPIMISVQLPKPGNYSIKEFSDIISIHYIAPALKVRIPLSRSSVGINLSIGYLNFRDYSRIDNSGTIFSKNSWGLGLSSDYSYFPAKHLSIDLCFSFLYSPQIDLRDIKPVQTTYSTPVRRNISRAEISAGMSYHIY